MNDEKRAARDFRLDGKVAVVTGGGSGIGQAIACRFAAHGAAIRILDVNEAGGQANVRANPAAGGEASLHVCDVTDQEQVNGVFAGDFRRERVSISWSTMPESRTSARSRARPKRTSTGVFRVNVKGYLQLHACGRCRTCEKRAAAMILNMASIAGSAGLSDRFAYSMSKGAVIAMTYSVARDYLAHNIRCNCISPARVHTPFVDDYLKKNLSRTRAGNVREAGEVAADRKNGGAGGGRLAGACSCARMRLHSSRALTIRSDGGFFNLRG